MSVNSVMPFIDVLAGLNHPQRTLRRAHLMGNIDCVVLTTQQE